MQNRIPFRPVLPIVCLAAGAMLWLTAAPAAAAAEPFHDGLGSYRMKVDDRSPVALRYFHQGIAFLHGFSHAAAIRSFQAATAEDPEFAMAHWGVALASGPHINFPLVPPEAAELAWRELGLAKRYAASATPIGRRLIEALAARYADPQPEDRTPLDIAYADAMRKVWQDFPDNADAGALFAEALMDLRPWDQWTPEGEEQPGTAEVLATLDAVLALCPDHPLANHLFIHAVEASRDPKRAVAAAERLRSLQPGLAHNVHMPSHIDVRLGKWQSAIDSNLKAVEADIAYRETAGRPKGLLNLYAAHNRHMLTFAALMTGQRSLATDHIRTMVHELPEEFLREFAAAAEGFAAMPLEVMIRFGEWEEILAEPDDKPDWMPFTRAMHSAARAIACAALDRTEDARREQAEFARRVALVPEEFTFGNNPARDILTVATRMVEGEILVREGKIDDGCAALRSAIEAEDRLHYDEPPGWMVPVRHALGATLVKAGRFAEAEQVYRDDLARLPDNGWALYGLAQCLRARPDDHSAAAEATEIEARFARIWSRADAPIHSSCHCQIPETAALEK